MENVGQGIQLLPTRLEIGLYLTLTGAVAIDSLPEDVNGTQPLAPDVLSSVGSWIEPIRRQLTSLRFSLASGVWR